MRIFGFARGRAMMRAGVGGVRLRLVGLILLVALPLVAVLGFALCEDRARNIEAAHENALVIARRGGAQFEAAIAGMRSLLQVLSLAPEVVSGSPETCAAFFARAATKLPWASQFWVMGSDGRIVCSTVPSAVGEDRSDRDYFKRAVATRDFGVSDFVRGRSSGTPGSVLAFPVLDEAGAVTRVLSISLKLGWFTSLFAEVAGHSGATMMLIDGQGVLMARYPLRAEWIGTGWRGRPLIERMEIRDDGWTEFAGVQGTDKIAAWAAVPGTPAHIAVSFDRAVVLADVNRKTIQDALVVLFAMASAILAGGAVARGIVRPLKHLTEGAEAARNSPDGTLPKITGYAEATSLAASLDALLTDRRRREESFRLLFENNPVPMWVHARTTCRLLAVNDAALGLYGHGRDKFLTMTTHDLQLAEYVAENAPQRSGMLQERNWRHVRADGSPIEVTSYSRALDYEGRAAKLVALVDVTDRKRVEARITHMAHHDDLTGLANRLLFRQCLDAAAKRSRDHGRMVGVLYIDLDNFKDINDALGHPIGDLLLRAVAARLSLCVRKDEIVARLGGDEFALIQDGIGGPGEIETVAARLIEVLGEPYDIEGRVVTVAASVGIAMAPRNGEDTESLLRYADLALYSAKADGGRTFKVFEPEMNLRLQARRALEHDLRDALANDELELHYQPSIDLASGRVAGFEALLRWSHPERGAISPVEFVPIAENIGLIDGLGEWVLRRACADAAGWPSDVRVAVNLSPLQFKSRKVLQSVLVALASSGVSARRLELEITESVLLQENEANLATLHELRALGARIALDDFGIGYSSLSYLRMFPFDKIKIDRSFVMALPDNQECVKIIRAMVELAKSLGMDTTAEGIETSEQLAHLRGLGCAEGQGFLFSRARPAREVSDMLTRGRSSERAA
jgi:diguanylate cyclase (GGDEF)-like protein/PAS domain S-box-containing protein